MMEAIQIIISDRSFYALKFTEVKKVVSNILIIIIDKLRFICINVNALLLKHCMYMIIMNYLCIPNLYNIIYIDYRSHRTFKYF